MTGFANHTCEFPGGIATLEVRSVNNRGLDLKLRVPDLFATLEPKLRETITVGMLRFVPGSFGGADISINELSARLTTRTATAPAALACRVLSTK